ncbi:MAG: alpha-amylase family glycosyl hydrolase [Candidatus Sumerlaeia bacterium]|nr:alpha-amylase family glycosyl hydrolase [Candidatus Sumerlaeia bacterium]
MNRRRAAASLLAAASLAATAAAGPVPGVETFTKSPVPFEHPAHLEVWAIGEDDYLVTFVWKPGRAVASPAVAGDFNKWDRQDLPMEGPDAEGAYRVTARLSGGDWRYKFVCCGTEWITDPLNAPSGEDGGEGGNSVLRLGLAALLSGRTAARGDGEVFAGALEHRNGAPMYFDVFTPRDVLIRARAMKGDAGSARLEVSLPGGGSRTLPMPLAATDSLFDFYEAHYHAPEGGVPEGATYSIVLEDGEAEVPVPGGPFPLRIDAARIPDVPEWAKHAIWYQIFIERFRDGDAANNVEKRTADPVRDFPPRTHPWRSDWYAEQPYEREGGQTFWRWGMYNRMYGGDFAGVKEKLDYLKDLGVNAVYFNPVFEAQGPHKYNARNFVHADDGFGTLGGYWEAVAKEDLLDSSTWTWTESDKALLDLVSEMKKRGIRVIFDGVWNHVGTDHPAFQDVKKNGRASRFADWFEVTSWEPFEYKGWAGYDALPEFKKTATGLQSESLRRHIWDVTRRWMDPDGDGDPSDGIDGWRLDVPNELPLQFWADWRKHVKSINPDAYITGEIWDPAEPWLDGTKFDAVMNYQFAKAAFRFFGNVERRTTVSQFDAELSRLRMRYPRAINSVMQNLFDSHDTDRWASRLMNPDMDYDTGAQVRDGRKTYFDGKPTADAYRRLRLMALFQATYLGAPMIFYGTEAGMYGADDPMCRKPMWWDDLAPYDNPSYAPDAKLRGYFRDLFRMRGRYAALRTGDFTPLLVDDRTGAYVFFREASDDGDGIIVALNSSGASLVTTTVPLPPNAVSWDVGLGVPPAIIFNSGDATRTTAAFSPESRSIQFQLEPLSGVVVRVRVRP